MTKPYGNKATHTTNNQCFFSKKLKDVPIPNNNKDIAAIKKEPRSAPVSKPVPQAQPSAPARRSRQNSY